MKLETLHLSNFRCFGPKPISVSLADDVTTMVGANGAGKTAALVALTRLFGIGQNQRSVRKSDFHLGVKAYRDSQKDETEQQARLDIRERWKKFISRATSVFAKAEAALSKSRIKGIDTDYKSMFGEIMQIGDVVCKA